MATTSYYSDGAFGRSESPVKPAFRRTGREMALSGAAAVAVVASGVTGLFLGQAIAATVEPEVSSSLADVESSSFVKEVAETAGVVGTSSAVVLSLGSLVGIAIAGNRESRRNLEATRAASAPAFDL